MSRRREIELRKRSLGEIREIMSSMKTLAFMETRKLAYRLEHQHRIVKVLQRAAADFLSFYPYTLVSERKMPELYLVIGTERGFCGDLNDKVRSRLEVNLEGSSGRAPMVMAVGGRLCTQLADNPHLAATVEGADTVEEADRLIAEIIGKVYELSGETGPVKLVAVYQGHGRTEVSVESVLPPFLEYVGGEPVHSHPPLLNLEPSDFLLGLVDQYTLATLHEIVYASLMNENQRRVQQLESAVRHLDDRIASLKRRSNQLRQEEIIEEIEVILLGAVDLN